MEYYLRIRGKVYGPYTEQQILAMRSKGSISRTTEISDEGDRWLPAAEYAFLYSQPVKPVSKSSTVFTAQEPDVDQPFDDEQPSWLWQRIGAIVALAALLAAIILGVALFTLLQKPFPPSAAPAAAAGDGAAGETPGGGTGASADDGAGETPAGDDGTSADDETSTDAGAAETLNDVGTSTDIAADETSGNAGASTDDTLGETPTSQDATFAGDDTDEPTMPLPIDPPQVVTVTGTPTKIGTASSGAGDANGGGSSATTSVFGALGTGRHFIFILDRSSSMNGQPFRAASDELFRAVSGLNEKQKICVISYDDQLDGPFPNLVPASDKNKNVVRRFLDSIAPRGGTKHEMPLIAAVRMNPDIIFLITDAASYSDLDIAAYQRILQLRRASQIHVIQFGGHDSPQLKRLTRETGGSFVQHAQF